MFIKNTQDVRFVFEGTSIEPSETIEVDSQTGQRLLALYWHRGLELIDNPEPKAEAKADEAKEQLPEVEGTVICPICGKKFASQRGLDLHSKTHKTK